MVRVNELNMARTAARVKAGARVQGAERLTVPGVLVGLDDEAPGRVLVRFGGASEEPVSVAAGPGGYVPGGLVSVLVDGYGRPLRVAGPLADVPVGYVTGDGVPAPVSVTNLPSLVPPADLSGEDRALVDGTAAGLAEVKRDFADRMRVVQGILDDFRARVDNLDIPDVSGLASKQELDAAMAAAEAAANAYAEAQASGAEASAIAEAKELADSARAAAEVAAKAYADDRYTVLKGFADGLQAEADQLAVTVGENSAAARKAQADATAAYALALNGDIALDRLKAGRIKPEVREALIADLAIIGYLQANQAWIGDVMLKDGSVTAGKVDIVSRDPDTGYGMNLNDRGIIILDGDGQPSVSLRTDMENYLGIIKDGAYVASISPEGAVTGQTVAANENFLYRGTELAEILGGMPGGLIERVMLQRRLVSDGPWALLAEITFTPEPGRTYTAMCTYAAVSSANVGGQVAVNFDGDGLSFKRSWGLPMWPTSPNRPISGTVSFDFEISDANVAADGTATLKFWGRSNSPGQQLAFIGLGTDSVDGTTACGMSLYDMGPRQGLVMQNGWAAPRGSSSSTTTSGTVPAKRTTTWTATGFKTYSTTSLSHVRAGSNPIQGAISGTNSRAHILFDDADIRAKLAGATISSVEVYVNAAHTYASTGGTVVLHSSNYSSAPASFGSSSPIQNLSVPRGTGRWFQVSGALGTRLRDGTARSLALNAGGNTSSQYYLYLSWTDRPKIRITYTK